MSDNTNQEWDGLELFDPFAEFEKLDAQQRADRLERLYSIAQGFGPWEYAVFHSIEFDYGQVKTVDELIQRAFGRWFERNPTRAMQAIDRCFDSGWIQFLTAEFLERKQRELDEAGYLITSSGFIGFHYKDTLPIGYVSFGEAGAKVWRRWHDSISQDGPSLDHAFRVEDGVEFVYGATSEACHWILDEWPTPVLHRGEPIEVGRWCERWWNLYERGYKVSFSAEPLESDQ